MTMEGTYYIENGKVTGLDTIVDIDLPEKYLNSKDQMLSLTRYMPWYPLRH